ncbi:MAG TPA: DUF1580 domain-containing protein [Pirellulales bacterium]|nr:DUF1580 domain-containing protein [Pirellulales bacterium]
MAIDLANETPLSLSEATALLPGRPHLSTVWRWVLKGVRGVRLETLVSGGRRYTTHEALERFVAGTTAAAHGQPAPVRTPKQRARAIAAAEAELERAGIA